MNNKGTDQMRRLSAPLLFAYGINRFSLDVAHIISDESNLLYDVLKTVCDRIIASKDHLDSLDQESGDSDCGSTIARGAQCK